MARYNANRIPYAQQERLMDLLCHVLHRLRSPAAVRNFLKDLLNRQERLMLVRRLLIAELLLRRSTYRQIQERLRVGSATIARVDRWLHFGRGGYRAAVAATRGGRKRP